MRRRQYWRAAWLLELTSLWLVDRTLWPTCRWFLDKPASCTNMIWPTFWRCLFYLTKLQPKILSHWSHMNLVLGKPLVHVTGETKSRAWYPGCSKLNSWVEEWLPILICSGPEWRGGLLVHPHFHREQDLAWQLGGALLLLLLLLMFSEGVFAQNIISSWCVSFVWKKITFQKAGETL